MSLRDRQHDDDDDDGVMVTSSKSTLFYLGMFMLFLQFNQTAIGAGRLLSVVTQMVNISSVPCFVRTFSESD